ncbi:hypothetical protein [Alloactinosynnema sp. L-07]|nr:hypothetical protein [Alloactinosynnema sp. L-07]CRK57741.1 hypothetical protein [Alloactinosynnema sp. L-07]
MDELDRRITDLRRMRDSLADLAATCDLPRADRRCPLGRSLREDGEDAV